MTIQDLEVLAADLYKDAEESSPIFGHTEKKDWMAWKLEEDIEENGAMVKQYLAYEDTDGVLNDLEQQYDNSKHHTKHTQDKDEDITGKQGLENTKEKDKLTDRKEDRIVDDAGDTKDDRTTKEWENVEDLNDQDNLQDPEDELLIVETDDEVIIFETENVEDNEEYTPEDKPKASSYASGTSSRAGKCHR